jgi:predicted secreted protein
MSLVGGIAIFFVVWWLCLFVVLPFGVTSQHETDDIAPGSEPGAPSQPFLFRRVLATTALAAVVFAGLYLYFNVYELRLDDVLP